MKFLTTLKTKLTCKWKLRYKNRWAKGFFFFLITALIITAPWAVLSYYQHTRYTKDYNCDDMSYDCADIFVSFGIPTQVVHGTNPKSGPGHCWVRLWGCIDFEATSLSPNFSNKNYYNVYLVEDWPSKEKNL